MDTRSNLRLAALGDVMLARDVGRHYVERPDDFAMGPIRDLLQTYDIVCANLENPVGVTGRPDPHQDPNVTFDPGGRLMQLVFRFNW